MKVCAVVIAMMWLAVEVSGQVVRGRVVSAADGGALTGAVVMVRERSAWTVTDDEGRYELRTEGGEMEVEAVLLGFAFEKKRVSVEEGDLTLNFNLKNDNLQLDEVQVTARRGSAIGSSYTIDRVALEHLQGQNLSDVTSLLPGGKTPAGSNNLADSDNRLLLRAEDSESGNAAFGTVLEVDGVRLDNNANAEETRSLDTRSLSLTNIASVEVVTGIASVEHGDLTSGMVRVRTFEGQTPLSVVGSLSPHTKQVAVSRGLRVSSTGATLNLDYDLTRSVSDLSSPHKAYLRNTLQAKYNHRRTTPGGSLSLAAGATANIGGLNTESDPDAFVDTYTRKRDRSVRAFVRGSWLVNARWLTSLEGQVSASFADRRTTTRTNESSAASTPYIHSTAEGYYIGQDYDEQPDADIVMSPTGYWYLTKVSDNRPLDLAARLKASLSKNVGRATNTLTVGAQWSRSSNVGRGVYYTDMRYAPTWREWRYSDRPAMNTFAVYAEDRHVQPLGAIVMTVVAGVRGDMTCVDESDYGTATSLSPRGSMRLTLKDEEDDALSRLDVYGGWGRAVKMPSFQVLYPDPAYSDVLAFTASRTDGTAFYAYYTHPEKALYNADLKWQYSDQAEVGLDMTICGARLSLAAYWTTTRRPYMRAQHYTNLTYRYTSTSEAEASGIDADLRQYAIDQQTGEVTVTSSVDPSQSVTLEGRLRNKLMSTDYYTNGSKVKRCGIDFVLDLPKIKAIGTTVRIDGKYYRYRSADHTLVEWAPTSQTGSDGDHFRLVGYYDGTLQSSVPDAGESTSMASVANGKRRSKVDLNLTLTTHVPRIRLIVTAKLEASLYDRTRLLCEGQNGTARGRATSSQTDYQGEDTDVYRGDRYVIVYPTYYADLTTGGEKLPFAERFEWARQNDTDLYNDLRSLVVRSNTIYYMNAKRVDAYCSANLKVTKEIGERMSVSFYATNFFNNMARVRESDTGLETTLYNSSYIPQLSYGLTMKVKI